MLGYASFHFLPFWQLRPSLGSSAFAYCEDSSSAFIGSLSSMATHKRENYLRTYRKRSGLTQREVAFLVGCRNGAQVSRYEKRRRLPPLRTALACEAAFGVPVSELFAGLREASGQAVAERLLALKSKIETGPAQGREVRLAAQKLRWLAERRSLPPENTNS